MNGAKSAVAVCIPCRSGDGDLGDTIDAVVAQTHADVECLIVVPATDAEAVCCARQAARLYPEHVSVVAGASWGDALSQTHAPVVLPLWKTFEPDSDTFIETPLATFTSCMMSATRPPHPCAIRAFGTAVCHWLIWSA